MSGNKRKKRKIFLLFIVILITSVVLTVETYAWFVGLSTVNTSSFNISVSSGSGLEISMDGQHWHKDDDVLVVNSATIAGTSTATGETTSNAYSGNTNSWVDANGLVPVSSSGILDTSTGRLNFFEKSSLSSTAGGYKLVASPIDHTSGEAGSYVAFDIFIRNGTENVYANSNYDDNAAENIYLTKTSSATVNGSTAYGAANSVRVGFFMLAGMKSYGAAPSQDYSTIRGLSCSSTTSSSTNIIKLCPSGGASQGLYWNIWEPNHASHTDAVKTYFDRACRTRDSNGNYNPTTHCTALDSSTVTYPIYATVGSGSNVDIYDGLNGYASNIYDATHNTDGKLYNLTTYKTPGLSSNVGHDTQLFKLGGNSITRVRVYIWLEGQDPDNYDIITSDSQIKVNFGFTKDRYDIDQKYVYSITNNNINSAISGTRYSTFNDAKTAFNHPTSIAHILNNTTIKESYVAFEVNGVVYYLRGGVNENTLGSKPIYESNVNTLKRAFGSNWSTSCTENSSGFYCPFQGFNANASTGGYVQVRSTNTSWTCYVAGNGSSTCSS